MNSPQHTGNHGELEILVSLSENKVMKSWKTRDIIHIDRLQQERAINGAYHGKLLDQFKYDLIKNYHLAKKKVQIYQNNARAHTCNGKILLID